ncbi:TIGR03557 family F420-dependent LLM class oxidoreductase [Aquihabitans sp. G128]|uniref:TIGR03557 family F420-dependent LLM class oxidoreductase n=1 Tax=Aquihabitans sp. G128 TaxID=2849779 RepID=UPI001C215AED|nr:TIGR03557 family F420-dependent LLM class oxidoreductase [Aquihabitans sp. G128]QXC59738.1 TIGR03557 family F420-dependent LLM class oxidoreductase [Aquihabitans sp. G128]
MTRFGLKLMSELRGPRELVAHAVAAEEAGFGFVAISDHIHPWLSDHDHSPFAWSVLGAVAHATSELDLATGLTCPIGRYHPVIVAQAAATVAAMTDRRLILGVGAGERLNEHVTGEPFPAVDVRHERLEEAIAILQALWTGEWTTIRGRHLTVEDARIFDLPTQPIELVVGVSGPASLDLAQRTGVDGIMATEPEASLVDGWADRGGDRAATWTEVPFAWAPTAEEGQRLALERFRFGAPGWKVMSELPNPVNFDAACETVRAEDLADSVPSGPDPEPYVRVLRSYLDAGFENVSIVPVGDDLAGTIRFWQDEVQPALAHAG